jgi:hypothetical protein
MSDKDEIIKKTYYDRSGFSSIQKTYQNAKSRNNTITLEKKMKRIQELYEEYDMRPKAQF